MVVGTLIRGPLNTKRRYASWGTAPSRACSINMRAIRKTRSVRTGSVQQSATIERRGAGPKASAHRRIFRVSYLVALADDQVLLPCLTISTGCEVPLVWHMHPEPSRSGFEQRHVAFAPLVPG
jgi:hypothetical protein